MSCPAFEAFPKIPRLRRTVIVTEKIDGTNAQIVITPEGEVFAGSRNRYITPEQDNYGFATWVHKNEHVLRTLLGPGRHYGEWWGTGIQRGYDLREKRFSLFNTSRWKPADGAGLLIHECGVYVVPTLAISEDHDVIRAELEKLQKAGSVAAPGYMKPEGVVVYHTAAGSLFKVLLENDHLAKGQAAE